MREVGYYVSILIRYNTALFSLRPICVRYFVHARGVRVVVLEHESLSILKVISLHLKSWTSLYICFI